MTLWEQMLPQIVKEYEDHPKDFLRQPMIRRTMHPDESGLAGMYLKEMYEDPFFNNKMIPFLKDTTGNPLKFIALDCSPLTIQHAYHLWIMRREFGQWLPESDFNNIIEIGGGYGNLARLIHNFGWDGKYQIFDFPEVNKIQDDYLINNGISSVEYPFISDINVRGKSMLIATFSLNEMPMNQRDMLENYYNDFDAMFFIHNKDFDGIDNLDYFIKLGQRWADEFDIKHFKDNYKRAWFMTCERKIV